LQQRGGRDGIVQLDESLAELVRAGKIDVAQARTFAEAPDDLEALVAHKPFPLSAPVQAAPPAQGMFPERNRPPEEQAMDLGGLLSKTGSLFGGKKG
jgi:hypothetical protein